MDFYAAWPSLLCLLTIMLVASTPLMRFADSAPTTARRRVQTLDGLRGFLALGVFFHHSAVFHQYLLTGTWDVPPSAFYTNIGHAGVTLFFMITGYLFWSQMLRTEGKPNFIKLYVGRIFRIVPLYLFLAVIVFLIVGILTDWRLQVPPSRLLREAVRWLSGGILAVDDINGHADTCVITAYVTWSLQFEWFFYASLLVTALFARHAMARRVFPIAGFLVAGLLAVLSPTSFNASAATMFFSGMIAAQARSSSLLRSFKAPQWAMSTLIALLLAQVLFSSSRVYGLTSITLLGLAFLLVVFDGTLFGLLLTRSARRLGDISYGIYLLQGPVLFLAFRPAVARASALSSPWLHWGVVLIAAMALVALATATHVLIENPGVRAGRWVTEKVSGLGLPRQASSAQHS